MSSSRIKNITCFVRSFCIDTEKTKEINALDESEKVINSFRRNEKSVSRSEHWACEGKWEEMIVLTRFFFASFLLIYAKEMKNYMHFPLKQRSCLIFVRGWIDHSLFLK